MQTNNPNIVELVLALSRFLKHEVQPQLTGATAYNAKIANNVLSIIERELSLTEPLNQAEQKRLQKLLNTSASREELNQTLIEKIKTGELDNQSEELMNHLLQTAMGKLSIDNPRYVSGAKNMDISSA